MSKNPYDRASNPAKRHSAAMTDGPDRAPARAMLKAVAKAVATTTAVEALIGLGYNDGIAIISNYAY